MDLGVTGGVSSAYLLSKRVESITLHCLGGQVDRVDSGHCALSTSFALRL